MPWFGTPFMTFGQEMQQFVFLPPRSPDLTINLVKLRQVVYKISCSQTPGHADNAKHNVSLVINSGAGIMEKK